MGSVALSVNPVQGRNGIDCHIPVLTAITPSC